MKLLQVLPLVLMFMGALILAERLAYAYADPGTGLLALQAAGSALVATGWYLRRKIYTLLQRDKPAMGNQEENASIVPYEDSRIS